jgi:hypothetical protein
MWYTISYDAQHSQSISQFHASFITSIQPYWGYKFSFWMDSHAGHVIKTFQVSPASIEIVYIREVDYFVSPRLGVCHDNIFYEDGSQQKQVKNIPQNKHHIHYSLYCWKEWWLIQKRMYPWRTPRFSTRLKNLLQKTKFHAFTVPEYLEAVSPVLNGHLMWAYLISSHEGNFSVWGFVRLLPWVVQVSTEEFQRRMCSFIVEWMSPWGVLRN